MKHPANQSPRPAFTLVEMLIVISIIGLLAALLFPVFARVRESARTTSCSSNLRQLGLAFTQYTQDYGGRYPGSGDAFQAGTTGACFASTCNGWQKGAGHWVSGAPGTFLADTASPFAPIKTSGVINHADVEDGALFSYVKSASTFYCPSDPYGSDKKLSYSMNCALTLLSQTRIRTPADIVLLVDEQGPNDGYFWAVNAHKDGPPISNISGVSPPAGTSTDQLTTRHNGGGNLLFVDGHVKFFQFNEFPLDNSPQGLANKWKTAGSPRFHDRAFGKYGSNTPPGMGTGRYMNDFCDASAGPGTDDGTANRP